MSEDKEVYEDEITCPYCGYVYMNSFEFPDDGKEECLEIKLKEKTDVKSEKVTS